MTTEFVQYVRNDEYAPEGAIYIINTGIQINGKNVISVGWSKACKQDTFIKKIGRNIAMNRAIKTKNFIIDNKGMLENNLTTEHNIDTYVLGINTPNIPKIIKIDFKNVFDLAKKIFGYDDSCMFFVPNITKNNEELLGNVGHSYTKYIKIIY